MHSILVHVVVRVCVQVQAHASVGACKTGGVFCCWSSSLVLRSVAAWRSAWLVDVRIGMRLLVTSRHGIFASERVSWICFQEVDVGRRVFTRVCSFRFFETASVDFFLVLQWRVLDDVVPVTVSFGGACGARIFRVESSVLKD